MKPQPAPGPDCARQARANSHELPRREGANSVRVTLSDGTQHEAKSHRGRRLERRGRPGDRGPPEKLIPLTFGDSSTLLVGQKILALGNPFGLERTLTSGIISSLDRSMKAKNGRMIKGIIQTDAAINPGNSAAPSSTPGARSSD